MNDIERLREELRTKPSGEKYLELAKSLSGDPGDRPEARECCMRALTLKADDHVARLWLAKLFYLDGMTDFCIRELLEIQASADSPAVNRLVESFGGLVSSYLASRKRRSHTVETTPGHVDTHEGAQVSSASSEGIQDDVVAEVDLDMDFIDALEEIESGGIKGGSS